MGIFDVSREQIKEFCGHLGFDSAEVSEIVITPREVKITCYARENSGQIYLIEDPDSGQKDVATFTKTLPIV